MTVLTLFTLMLVFSANLFSQDKTAQSTIATAELKAGVLTPEQFQDVAENMVGKEVEIEGMVVHVCKHGGKKMFLIGEDPDVRVKITTSDKVSTFKPELEGSTVYVKGIIEPMDEVEVVAKEELHEDDDDHKNYYHKPQFSLSCLAFKEVK